MFYAIKRRFANGMLFDDLRLGRCLCVSEDCGDCERLIPIHCGIEIIESPNGMDFYAIQGVKALESRQDARPLHGQFLFSVSSDHFSVKKAY